MGQVLNAVLFSYIDKLDDKILWLLIICFMMVV